MSAWKELDLTDATPEFLDRYWSKVQIGQPDECWEWAAHCMASGYGLFTLRKGVFTTASRVSLALTVGVLYPNQVACHRCDNPPCCNPAHLFVGTQVDNTLDSVRKGRARRARGESATSAKLTERQVREIRRQPEQLGLHARLAQQYGVSAHTIKEIRRGRYWAHVDEPTNRTQLCPSGHVLAGANLLPSRDPSRRTWCATCAESFRVSRLVSSRRAS